MSPLIVAIISATIFVGYASFILIEEKRGNRLFLVGLRTLADTLLVKLFTQCRQMVHFVTKRVITLSWYYSLHAILKMVLKFLAGLYFMVEQLLIRNRNKARQLRRSHANSHLAQLSDHQKETALTESEKKKRKAKALKG